MTGTKTITTCVDIDSESNGYSRIDYNSRNIYLCSDVSTRVAVEITTAMSFFDSTKEPVFLIINSYGGDVASMIQIINAVKNSQNPVVSHVMGVAYSAAAYIALSANIRTISQFGLLMYHEWSWAILDRATEQEKYTDIHIELSDRVAKHLLSNTKVKLPSFKKRIKSGDWYVLPDEALKLGLVNKIIE